jgi:hypothetical protein
VELKSDWLLIYYLYVSDDFFEHCSVYRFEFSDNKLTLILRILDFSNKLQIFPLSNLLLYIVGAKTNT